MISFFTALIIEYSVQGHTYGTYMWFETEEHCEQALRSNFYEVIYEHYEDTSMQCLPSKKMSRSIRPKLRPEQ